MIGDRLVTLDMWLDLTFRDQLGDIDAVVVNLIITAKLRKLIFEGIEAVWTMGNDQVELVAIERLNVSLRAGLIERLVTGATCPLAMTGFFLAQDCPIYTCCVQDLCY